MCIHVNYFVLYFSYTLLWCVGPEGAYKEKFYINAQ